MKDPLAYINAIKEILNETDNVDDIGPGPNNRSKIPRLDVMPAIDPRTLQEGKISTPKRGFVDEPGSYAGNTSNHPVKPLTKDQKKIYDMMLKEELPTNRPSVSKRLVERFNKPWEKLDNTARANFINQTYPRYKKLLERAEGKISRNQLAKILSEKLDRPISLGQIYGYGSNRSGQRQKTEFGKTLDEVLDVTNVTPKNPMYKIPTDADIKKLKPLLDITPSNSLKNSTVDNIVKLNKKYTGMYKSGKLPSLETVLKDFPNMTSTQASNATIRLSQIYSGSKFKLFSNLDPKIKKAAENIKVDKKLGDKVFKLIGNSKFNEYRNSMYRISLGIIDEKLGNKKGTFEKLKNQARQVLKDNKIPVYSPEKKNAAGKIIQKAKKGFNINEIAGVSGSARSKAAEFSQFIDVMEGNLNQTTMANFQSKLSSARQLIENNPSTLSSESKKINKIALNLEKEYNIELPRLRDPDATKYFSQKRLKELQSQGLDIVKAAERAGYTMEMPKSAQTIKEFIDPNNKKTKAILQVVLNFCPRARKKTGASVTKCTPQEAANNMRKKLVELKQGKLPIDEANKVSVNLNKVAKVGARVGTKGALATLGPLGIGGDFFIEGMIVANDYLGGMPGKEAWYRNWLSVPFGGGEEKADALQMERIAGTEPAANRYKTAMESYNKLIKLYDRESEVDEGQLDQFDLTSPGAYNFEDALKAEDDVVDQTKSIIKQREKGEDIFNILKQGSPEQQAFERRAEVENVKRFQIGLDQDPFARGVIERRSNISPALTKSYAGGGLAKIAGERFGKPPEAGPTPQGLAYILKRDR